MILWSDGWPAKPSTEETIMPQGGMMTLDSM
jgi:hypothetical protein